MASFLERLRPRRGLALVLGGGGNLGALEVGVVEVFAERGIRPDLLVGTSVGAINAAFFAFHPKPDAGRHLLSVWLRAAEQPLLRGGRLAVVRRMLGRMDHLYSARTLEWILDLAAPPGARIEDAPIPLALTVTDAVNGARRVLRSGPLRPALLASAAVPGIFPAVEIDGRRYFDGGVVANCDLEAVAEAGIGQALAVDLMGIRPQQPPSDIWDAFQRSVIFSLERQTRLAAAALDGRVRVAILRALLPHIPLLGDFSRTEELYEIGRMGARRLLDEHLDRRGRVRPGVVEIGAPGLDAGGGRL